MANRFSKLTGEALTVEAVNEQLGYARAEAIAELTARSLTDPALLASACKAIASDKQIGFHAGPPLGWFGADEIYLSGQERAMRALLLEMDNWDPVEQEDLVRHWAGKRGLAAVTRELQELYGWTPRYPMPG